MANGTETTEQQTTSQPVTADEVGSWLLEHSSYKDSSNEQEQADFNLMVEEYDRLRAVESAADVPSLEPVQADPTQDLGFIGGIQEAFTGSARQTPEVEALPRMNEMPELQFAFSMPLFKTAFGTIMGDQKEMADVISTNFPEVSVRYDSAGNPILRSAVNDREYIIAPGFEASDIPRFLSGAALFSVLRGRGYAGSAAAGGATQATYEGLQEMAGGEFDLPDVAAATAAGPVFLAFTNALKAGYATTLGRLFNKKVPPANAIDAPVYTDEELVDLARRSAEGSRTAQQELARLGAPDEKVLEAARRLGIEEHLQPDHLSTDQVFREISQAAKSGAGGQRAAQEVEGLQTVGQRALDLINELGGSTDLSRISGQVFRNLRNLIDNKLQPLENKLWNSLRSKIGEANRFSPSNTLAYLEERIAKVGGNPDDLFPLEKDVYNKLRPRDIMGKEGGKKVVVGQENPTYTLIDDWRKQVGAATKGRGAYGDKTDQGVAKELYKVMSRDAEAIALESGAEAAFKAAKDATKLLIATEDDVMSLFSKDLGNSLVPRIKSAIEAMGRGDSSKFISLMNKLPEGLRRRVAVSSVVNSFGRAFKYGELNFNSYSKWYEGLLRNREAKAVLDRTLGPEARKTFRDLYTISKNIKLSLDEKIRTGRPRGALEGLTEADSFLNKLWETAKRSAVGLPVEAGATYAGIPNGYALSMAIASAATRSMTKKESTKALDTLMGSPVFLNAIKNAGTAQEVQAADALANSAPFKRFLKAVNLPATEAQTFIMSAFQAARESAQEAFQDEAPAVEEEMVVPVTSVKRPAPPTRGLPTGEAPMPAPAGPQMAQAPSPTDQGPSQSRQMLADLFPFDPTLRVG